MKKMNKLSLYETLLVISMIAGSGLSFHKIYLYHIFMIINFFTFIYYVDKNKFHFILEDKIILVFFIYSLLHIFFSQDFALAVKNQIYILCGISIFHTFKILLKKKSIYILKLLKKIFIFIIFTGILEGMHIVRWYNSPYNIDLEFPSSFYGNTNNYATVLIMIFPFIFFMKNSIKKFIVLLLMLFTLKKCSSRTNEIALMIEVFIFMILIFYKSSIYKKIILFITGIFSIYLLKNKIINKFYLFFELFNAAITRNDSVGIRKILILNLLLELKKIKVFLFGVGGGNAAVIHKMKMGKLMSSHSFFLQLLVEYGIFIFILLGIYYLILISKNLKVYLKTNNYINGSLFISLIGVAIGLNSMSGVIYFFPFWCLLSIADFYAYKELKDE